MDLKMVKESFSGLMDKYMMENGKKANKMEAGCGKDQMMNAILVNGKMEVFKDLESFSRKQGTDMKESLKTQRSMV